MELFFQTGTGELPEGDIVLEKSLDEILENTKITNIEFSKELYNKYNQESEKTISEYSYDSSTTLQKKYILQEGYTPEDMIDTECSIGVSNVEPIEDEIISVLKKTIDTLQNQLDTKDSQIDKLTEALIISQKTSATEQALHAGTMQKQLQKFETKKDEIEVVEEKISIWKRLFGK